MKTKPIRVVVDIMMFFSMCFLFGTGLLIHYRLVPGYRGGHGLSLLGLTRHEWGYYHLCFAYILVILVLIHLVLNLRFIRNSIAMKKYWIIIALAVAGLLVIVFFLLMPIKRNDHHNRRYHPEGVVKAGQSKYNSNHLPEKVR